MLKGLKINTAIVICVAFLFRLFTLSTGFISSVDSKDTTKNSSETIVIKKELAQVASATDSKTSYSELEFSEEDSDDENEFKAHTTFLMELFYAPVQHSVVKQMAVISPANKHYISSSSQRHLEFGVFRI